MREIERFKARDDKGRVYTIVAMSADAAHRPIAGAASTRGGRVEYFLEDGRDVSPDGRDFEIVLDEVKLFRLPG